MVRISGVYYCWCRRLQTEGDICYTVDTSSYYQVWSWSVWGRAVFLLEHLGPPLSIHERYRKLQGCERTNVKLWPCILYCCIYLRRTYEAERNNSHACSFSTINFVIITTIMFIIIRILFVCFHYSYEWVLQGWRTQETSLHACTP